jgi:ActR/RegA family two-component response regulator
VTAPAHRPALLLVDDEPVVLFAMRAYFEGRGFAVDCVESLADALGRVRHTPYAAVVSDLRLSGSEGEEGLELLRELRAGSSATPFVLLTGFGTPAATAEAARFRASAVLTKPRPLAEIAAVVLALLAA